MSISALRSMEARALGSYTLLTADLAVFRFLYAAFLLVAVVPVAVWLPLAPDAFFYPPIGLAALFTGPPPPFVLYAFNVVLALFAAMLLVGWRTGVASAGTGLTLLALNSWAYCLGKINHDILLVITPLVLGFSGWGRALSIDAFRHPSRTEETAEAWPVAVLAVLVGFSMFTAGWAKATTGWLDPDLRCTYGYLAINYLITGRETWAGHLALHIDSAWFWKVADWSVVVLEVGFLPAALHRRVFCLFLAAASLFHLGVLLLFDIPFPANILTYGAFIRYMKTPFFRAMGNVIQPSRSIGVVTIVICSTLGLAATMGRRSVAALVHVPVVDLVIWAAASVGAWHIFKTLCFRIPKQNHRLGAETSATINSDINGP